MPVDVDGAVDDRPRLGGGLRRGHNPSEQSGQEVMRFLRLPEELTIVLSAEVPVQTAPRMRPCG